MEMEQAANEVMENVEVTDLVEATDWKSVGLVFGAGVVGGVIITKAIKPVVGLIKSGIGKLRGKVTKDDFHAVEDAVFEDVSEEETPEEA